MSTLMPSPNRRHVLMRAAGVAMSFTLSEVWAAPATLPSSVSLPDELAHALQSGNPLVVMVSLAGCPYCKIARENYLGPMHLQLGLPVVQLDMQSTQATQDFKRAVVTHDQLIRTWGAKIAPTVLFFGRHGVEIAERLEGGYLPDFYGAYLDARLSAARLALKTV